MSKNILIRSALMFAVNSLPTTSQAATATFNYTSASYSSTVNGTYTPLTLTGSPATGYLISPAAAGFIKIGMQVTVTGNPNAAAATAYNSTVQQPALLGLNSFGLTLSSAGGATPVASSGNTGSVTLASVFDVRTKGTIAGNTLSGLAGGVLAAANIDASDSSTLPKATIGATGAQNIFTLLNYQVTTGFILTPAMSGVAFVVNATPGDANTPPTYTTRVANGTDTLIGPGTLSNLPEPASLAAFGLCGLGLMARRRRA